MLQWFAVHTQPRAETKAAFHLLRQGYSVYLPTYLKKRRHARKTDIVKQPLFPRYLFVAIDGAKSGWRAINSTVGVLHIVSDGGRPAPLKETVIEDIRSRENADGYIEMTPKPINRGQKVRIGEGPLKELSAVFDAEDDQARVTLLMDFLGRQVRVRMNAGALALES
ncbi:MAG: transcriptional activator RfaH [Rhodospirillales bacterium]